MKVNQYILHSLKNEGIDHLFFVPGGWIDPFIYEAVSNGHFKMIVAAHEAGAAYMADGYSRGSNRFGVCLSLGGPGLTNTITGIASAKTDLSPLLYISGEADTNQQGRGVFQDSSSYGIDSLNMLHSLTKMQLRVENPLQIVKNLERLLRKMLNRAAPGPVHLALPADIQMSTLPVGATPNKLPKIMYQTRFLDDEAANTALELLRESTHIAILAGAGVRHSGAWKTLIQFAEKFNIPVATTLGGKGVIPDNHRLSLGMLGWFGHRPATEALLSKHVDTLIVLGSRLNQFDTLGWTPDFQPKRHLILNDVATDSVFRDFHVDCPILGDAHTLLNYWLNLPESKTQHLTQTSSIREAWLQEIRAKGSFYFDEENCHSDIIPIHPARVIYELRQAMPANTVFYADSGAHSFFAGHYCSVSEPTQYNNSLKYMGAMGWAVPAGIGSKFAQPNLPHVVITGDGCMLMHGIEIQTAARYHLPMIFVVINNSALGNPLFRAEQISKSHAEVAKLPTHNWAKFAESLGVTGFSVTDPQDLKKTFEHALTLNKTVLIDVSTGNYPTPTYPFDHYYYHKKSYLPELL